MAKKIIRTGTTADPTGDSLKTAFTKVNDNFTELYNALGLDADTLNIGAFEFTGSVMTTTDSSAIVIGQATTVTSDLTVGGDIVPQTANNGDLGSAAKPWRSLYVSNNTIYIGNTAVSVNQSGKLTVGGSSISDSIDKIALGTSKLELTDEAASRLSLYNSNTEKSRIQINGNDLLLSSLSGGVVLAATDGVGGEWRFKTNGNLESTGGNFLSTAETPAVFGSLNSTSTGASSGTVTLKSGIGAVDGGSIYIEAGTGGSGNDGEVAIRTGSGPYEWLFDNGGNLTFPNSTVQTTAWTGDQTVSTTSSVKFNTVRSNILAPLTTGVTQYTIANIAPESPWTNPVITITGTIGPEWVNGSQLEITGVTTPTQANGTWYVQYRSANSFRLFNDAGLTSSPNASSWAAYTGSGIVKLPDSPANLTVVNNSNTWTFGTNGDLTVPRDIIAAGNVGEFGSVKTNYVSHVTGQTQIQVGDGSTSNGKTITIVDQRVRIMSAVPTTSIGSTGDYVGSVAFNSTYIYYCTANYDGVTNIWKRLAWSGDTW